MMIAHLSVPALDNTPISSSNNMAMPTTLSKKVVTGILKDEWNYKGLIVTDALNMKGVSSYFAPGVVDVKALLAGNDILLFSQDVGTAIREIKNAIKRGEISQEEIDERVRKILRAKYRVGLYNFQPIPTYGIKEELNTTGTKLLKQHLYENAITLAKDDNRIIPFNQLDQKRFASLSIGFSFIKRVSTHIRQIRTF